MKDRFTRVLKGHIAIAHALFPKGTTGAQLDSFARKPLWDAGLDFDHGTGRAVYNGPEHYVRRFCPASRGRDRSRSPFLGSDKRQHGFAMTSVSRWCARAGSEAARLLAASFVFRGWCIITSTTTRRRAGA